jgi:hypothetical protein
MILLKVRLPKQLLNGEKIYKVHKCKNNVLQQTVGNDVVGW